MRKRLLVLLVVCLSLILCLQPMASAGVLLGGGGSSGGSPGTWYIGATPPNVDYTKPVLVFVHGKGGWSGSWFEPTVYHGTNDMYAYAYNNGYRTAFTDLYPDKSMWANGELLNRQLDEITAYFGVSKVTIVAHSKGGLDVNSASVHYGANPKISRIVTLGSPHWGSPVADMAYSTWTWWLAALLGERNDATYVLQTGYMSYFRSITDGRDPVPYYTLSGYKCGPVFTALWMGCAVIGGEDDGLVGVSSARIPGGTHLKEGYWDHDEIRMGSRTWSWFAPVIRTAGTASPAVASVGAKLAAAGGQPTDAGRGNGKPEAPGSLIMRGGTTTEHATATFPVESGVRGATFTFLASSRDFTATLVGPDGSAQNVTMASQVDKSEVFAGAWTGSVTVANPAAGQWTLKAAAGSETGYFMLADLDSDLKATLDVGSGVAVPGAKQELKVGFRGKAPAQSRAEAAVAMAGQQVHGRPAFSQAGGVHTALLDLPAGNGIHNVTVTVTGTLPDGTAFERSLVTSVAAVAPGDRGTWK
ncbi:MAG TPA: hypothetical protein VNT75_03055 [Symbiobacteriaceae bacterium]|nr:hypothetical protein [Symbiobacteriaceae bacterium]